MMKKLLPILLLSLLLLTSCSPVATPSARYSLDAQSSMPEALPTQAAAMDPAAPAAGNAKGAVTGNAASSVPSAERMVIRNAQISMVVDEPGRAMETISRMASGMGGYVVSSNLYKTASTGDVEIPAAQITVRVAADRLNDALTQIHALTKDPAKDITSEVVTGQDVTKEYTDLSSRLKNLQETEAQLREIMKSAQKTEDVLAVYNQISQINEQIEIIQGQMQYYKESAALSSIAVNLTARVAIKPVEVTGWKPEGIARDALQSLVNTLQFIASAAIWIILYILPTLLIIAIPLIILFLIIRALMRRNRTPRTPHSAA